MYGLLLIIDDPGGNGRGCGGYWLLRSSCQQVVGESGPPEVRTPARGCNGETVALVFRLGPGLRNRGLGIGDRSSYCCCGRRAGSPCQEL